MIPFSPLYDYYWSSWVVCSLSTVNALTEVLLASPNNQQQNRSDPNTPQSITTNSDNNNNRTQQLITEDQIHKLILPSLRLGMSTFVEQYPNIQSEMKITIIISSTNDNNENKCNNTTTISPSPSPSPVEKPEKQGKEKEQLFLFDIWTHITELPPFPMIVNVEVRTARRHNPNIKDTKWVK